MTVRASTRYCYAGVFRRSGICDTIEAGYEDDEPVCNTLGHRLDGM